MLNFPHIIIENEQRPATTRLRCGCSNQTFPRAKRRPSLQGVLERIESIFRSEHRRHHRLFSKRRTVSKTRRIHRPHGKDVRGSEKRPIFTTNRGGRSTTKTTARATENRERTEQFLWLDARELVVALRREISSRETTGPGGERDGKKNEKNDWPHDAYRWVHSRLRGGRTREKDWFSRDGGEREVSRGQDYIEWEF